MEYNFKTSKLAFDRLNIVSQLLDIESDSLQTPIYFENHDSIVSIYVLVN